MIVAAIPLKRLSEAKSRLAPYLSDAERIQLALDLVERTVHVLRQCRLIDRVALATPETDLAQRLDVDVIVDRGSLNGAIVDAQRWASTLAAAGLLIVPADLPRLASADVYALLSSALPEPSVTIAPTRDGGTGALLLCRPDVISPAFGPQSFLRHRLRGDAVRARVQSVMREGFFSELDTIDDLRRHGLQSFRGVELRLGSCVRAIESD